MQDILDALAAQQRELAQLLDSFTDADWAKPSPCEGWSAADVVLHLAQTNEMAIASARGRLAEYFASLAPMRQGARDVDEGADLMVDAERGAPNAELRSRWDMSANVLASALADADPHARVDWVVGQLSVHTLATTRLAESWIHTGDVFTSVGREQLASDREQHIARLAWRTLPYAFARAGRGELSGGVTFVLMGSDGQEWRFESPDAATVVQGPAHDLCLVAARRRAPADTALCASGPDADAVLELVRTYA